VLLVVLVVLFLSAAAHPLRRIILHRPRDKARVAHAVGGVEAMAANGFK
jgi:hypothetical protein